MGHRPLPRGADIFNISAYLCQRGLLPCSLFYLVGPASQCSGVVRAVLVAGGFLGGGDAGEFFRRILPQPLVDLVAST